MKNLFVVLSVLILVICFTRPVEGQKHKKASGKAIVFKAEDFDSPQKIADQSEDLIDVSGAKYLKKYNVKKIGILEFYVEFLQNREIQQSAYESANSYNAATSGSAYFGPRKLSSESLKFSGDYYKDAVLMMYDVVTSELAKNGFEFLPKETISNDPEYKKLELESEVEGGGYKGGMFQRGESTSTIKLSVDGLGLMPSHMGLSGALAAISKNNSIKSYKAQLSKDKGLDAIAQVFVYIDKGKNGEPIVNTFNIVFDMGPVVEENRSYMDDEKATNIVLTKPITSSIDISGATEGSVDPAKYNSALFEILEIVAKMTGSSMTLAMK